MLGFEQKIADLEDHNRRCSIRVYGLREEESSAAVPLRRENGPGLLSSAVYASPHAKLSSVSRGNTPLQSVTELSAFAADFSDYTAKRRRAFSQAMALAREKGTDAFLIYPATLKIRMGYSTHLFTSAVDAERFLEKRPSPGRLVDVPVELGEEQAAPMTISPDHSDPHVGNE
ncbi:hypothetical protein KUCAC02_030196 [Chaenocephalus aceratus]|uniref:Uncharacterized protein n=1 Tax=Chaenocephalus aceratus TaxID=36190 RepID=A0ACB9XIS8_CHAAC|nr:hypothetical protein KUCAC02_030196 [Chaenocephalus aceratus]